MANAARRAGASIIWLFLPVLAIPAKANDVDPLGSVNSFGIPIESRSFDHSLRRYALGDVTYHVPRNYLASVEELTPGRAHGIFLDVLLPDFSGFTPSNAHCFQDRADPCHRDVVRVGLTHSTQPSAEQQIANLTGLLAHSAPQIGRCGFSHYEDASNVQVTRAGFDYFVRALANQSAASILRCPKEGAQNSTVCNGAENIGDGNTFYYVFDQGHVCQWEQIEQGLANLVRSFKPQGDKQ